MEKTNKIRKGGKFLQPILDSFSWEQLYLFIVLLGILPAVADYSLFRWEGFSQLDFLFGDPSQYVKILYIVPAAFLPIGLALCFKQRNPWMVIGLLPAIVGLLAKALSIGNVVDTALISLILSISYKVAFLYFAMKGRTRSVSFFAIVLMMAALLGFWQTVLFVFLTVLVRTIYLVISQNIFILAALEWKNLLRLFFRTFVAWCPILLFAVPGFVIPKILEKKAIDKIYAETFVDHHYLHTSKKMKDVMAYSVEDNLRKAAQYGISMEGHEQSQRNLDKALMVVKYRSDSLQYHDYQQGVRDFERLFGLYQKRDNPAASTGSTYIISKQVSKELEKVLVNRFMPGRTEFELDVELSVNGRIRENEEASKAYADSLNAEADKGLNAKIAETERKMNEAIAKSNDLERRGRAGIGTNKEALIKEAKANIAKTRRDAHESIDNVNASVTAELNSMPRRANDMFARSVPNTLVELDGGFAHTSGCGMSIKCHAFNMMKGLLREVYDTQREKAKKGVDATARAFRDNYKEKLDAKTAAAKAKVDARLDEYDRKADELANNAANLSNEALGEGFGEINAGIVESAKIVNDQMLEIKGLADEVNKELKSSVETASAAAEEVNKQTLLTVSRGLFLSKLWSSILLAFIVIKSYFYVFSRIAFSEKNNLYVDIKEAPKTYENGVLSLPGSEYSIPVDNKVPMYVSRKYMPTGRAPKIAIPQWTTGIVGRIRAGVYLMNEVEVRENETETVDFRSLAGAEFVEWELSDGEEVIFDYNDLVAMSEDLVLDTHISFKVTSLFFGKTIFRIAKGPGKLVLMTRGKPITDKEKHLIKSVPIERIIAWQRSTQFSIDSELNIADLYFSGLYLKRTNDDLIIIDADAGDTRRKVGLARFISKFILP